MGVSNLVKGSPLEISASTLQSSGGKFGSGTVTLQVNDSLWMRTDDLYWNQEIFVKALTFPDTGGRDNIYNNNTEVSTATNILWRSDGANIEAYRPRAYWWTSGATPFTANVPFDLGLSIQHTSGGDAWAYQYVNGVQDASNNFNSYTNGADNDIYLGSSGIKSFECYYIWGERFLTDSERQLLNNDPFCFLKPAANDTPYLIAVPDAGGATPTLLTPTVGSIGDTTATLGVTLSGLT